MTAEMHRRALLWPVAILALFAAYALIPGILGLVFGWAEDHDRGNVTLYLRSPLRGRSPIRRRVANSHSPEQ